MVNSNRAQTPERLAAIVRFHEALDHVLRTQCGNNQGTLAALLGVDRTRVSQWKAKKGVPGREMLGALGRVFGVSVNWILFGEGAMYRRQSRSPQALAADLAAHATIHALSALRRDFDADFQGDLEIDGDELLRSSVAIVEKQVVGALRMGMRAPIERKRRREGRPR